MIELLSLVFGGVLRLVPEFLKLKNAAAEQAHELRMTQLQLEIDKARAQQQIDLAHVQASIAADQAEMAAMVAALKAQGQRSGVKWIDGLSSSVRPVLTYWWCMVLYTAGKAIVIAVALQGNATLASLAPLVVTEFDRSIIASIFSFWFVDRALRRGKA